MASEVKISAPLAKRTVSVTAAANKIRNSNPLVADAIVTLAEAIQAIQQALRSPQTASRVVIDGADIQDLIVGGEKGPGQLTILSGPPSFSVVGWDGTGEFDDPVDISTFNDDTVVTVDPHGVQVGGIVLVEGTTAPYHNGYWKVASIVDENTFTVADPPTGNSAGGTAKYQFGGGWRLQFALGGDPEIGVKSAPVYTTPEGQVRIGKNGSVSLRDVLEAEKGFLGVVTQAELPVTAAANNGSGLIRLTVPAHPYETGDDVIVSLPGVLSESGDFSITVIDTNTFDLQGSVWGGIYTGSGTVYRYRGPFWGQTIAAGGTGYADALFRTFRDGSVRIGLPNGARLVITPDGKLQMINGELEITSGNMTVKINGTDGILAQDLFYSRYVEIKDGRVKVGRIADASRYAEITDTTMFVRGGVGGSVSITTTGSSSSLSLQGGESIDFFTSSTGSGHAKVQNLFVSGSEVINESGEGFLDRLELVTPLALDYGGTGGADAPAARTNLDVYSKAEINALLAGKADKGTYPVDGGAGGSVTI